MQNAIYFSYVCVHHNPGKTGFWTDQGVIAKKKTLINILVSAALTRRECSVLLTGGKKIGFFSSGVYNWLSKYQASDQR